MWLTPQVDTALSGLRGRPNRTVYGAHKLPWKTSTTMQWEWYSKGGDVWREGGWGNTGGGSCALHCRLACGSVIDELHACGSWVAYLLVWQKYYVKETFKKIIFHLTPLSMKNSQLGALLKVKTKNASLMFCDNKIMQNIWKYWFIKCF